MNVDQILITLVPVVISGIVAIVTSKSVADLKDQLAAARMRIARLEQALMDHSIPVPPLDSAWKGR